MVEEARSFAEKAHEGQFRKGTKRPYIVHPLEVAKIVSTMTDDEEIISAALLHDTLEDCRQVTKEQIKERVEKGSINEEEYQEITGEAYES